MAEHLWVFHHVGFFYFACRGIQGPGVHKVRDQLRGSCRHARDERQGSVIRSPGFLRDLADLWLGGAGQFFDLRWRVLAPSGSIRHMKFGSDPGESQGENHGHGIE